MTNKLVVFRKSGVGTVWRELIEFLPLTVVNYVVTLIIVAIIRRYTGKEYSGSVVAGKVTTALAYLVFCTQFSCLIDANVSDVVELPAPLIKTETAATQ